VRILGLSKKFAAKVFVCLLCAALLVAGAAAQQNTDDQDNAKSFVDSVAQTVYKLAWPTATYQRISDYGFEPAENGFDLTVTLSGLSGFDGSDLWLKIAFLFRNGKFADIQVRDDNAILMRPFVTSATLASVAVQLAQDYAKDQNQAQSPAPAETPQPPATDQAAPDTSSPQAAPAPAAGAAPDTTAQPGSADSTSQQAAPAGADPAAGFAGDIRIYLAAANGGFASLTVGDSHLTPDNLREWTLRAPAGAEIDCYPVQATLPVLDCPIYQSNKEDVDLMAAELTKDLNASLPEGWTSGGDATSNSDSSGRYVSFSGPGQLWAQLKPFASETSGQYWLHFQIVFPQ
jgi:hypothetical protein